jgi:hypothetical protein
MCLGKAFREQGYDWILVSVSIEVANQFTSERIVVSTVLIETFRGPPGVEPECLGCHRTRPSLTI